MSFTLTRIERAESSLSKNYYKIFSVVIKEDIYGIYSLVEYP